MSTVNCELNIPIPERKPNIVSLIPIDKLNIYSEFATTLVGNVFSKFMKEKNYTLSHLSNPKIVDEIFEGVKNMIGNIYSINKRGWEDGVDLPLGMTKDSHTIDAETLNDFKILHKNFDSFIDFHKLLSPLFNSSNKDIIGMLKEESIESSNTNNENSSDEEIQTEKSKEYDKAANEEDTYINLKNNIRQLFALTTMHKYNTSTGVAEVVKNIHGLPMSGIGYNIYNILISKINDVKNEDVLLSKFKDEQLNKIVPEMSQILDILNINNWESRTADQKQLWVDLNLAFSKPAIPIQSLTTVKNKKGDTTSARNVTITEDIKGNKNKIRNSWINNFNTTIDGVGFLKDDIGKIYILKDALPSIEPNNISEAVDFLKIIGIKISTDLFEKNKQKELNSLILTYSSNIYKTLTRMFQTETNRRIYDPISELSKGEINIKSESKTINSLINIESAYSVITPSNSTIDQNGERRHLIAEESAISFNTHHLNNSNSLTALGETAPFTNLKYDPLHKYSFILNNLFSNSGVRDNSFKLGLNFLSGTRQDTRGKSTVKFSRADKVKFDFATLFLGGKTDIMRPETSNSSYSISLIRQDSLEGVSDANKPFYDIKNFDNGVFMSSTIENQFLGYLNGELERIASYPEKLKTNKNLTTEYSKFNIFSGLKQKLKDELNEEYKTGEITKSSNSYKLFIAELNNLFNEDRLTYDKNLKRFNISDMELIPAKLLSELAKDVNKEDYIKQLKRSFIVNNFVQNIEYSILYSGSPLFNDKTKDGITVGSFHKRNKKMTSTGIFPILSNTSESIIATSRYTKNYSFKNTLIKSGVKVPEKPFNQIYSKVIKDRLSSDYTDFHYADLKGEETTNGQSWGNPDFAYELSVLQGWRNTYSDTVFEREGLLYKRDIEDIPLSNFETILLKSLTAKIDSDPENHTLSVMKAGLTGPIINSNVNGISYDKFSVVWLFPSFVKGNEKLTKVLKDMTKGGYDYIKYETGTKDYQTGAIDINDLGKSDVVPDILSKGLFKLQIAYKTGVKNTTTIPTQLLKLAFSNQFGSDVTTSDRVKKLYKDYVSNFSDIQKEQFSKLYESLGIDVNTNGEISNVNYKTLSNKLLKAAIDLGMNSNILKSLQYNEATNSFYTNPEISSSSELNKLLASIMDKTMRRYKVNGGDFTMVTNGENERLQPPRKLENGTVIKGECNITLTKEFSKLLNLPHPDGEKIGTLDRLNALIKKNKDGSMSNWAKAHEKSISLITDRVPTQEINSMDSLIITKFISPIMGNIIQMYDEIVVKAGSDFDYDKVKALLPSFNNKGEYVNFDKSKETIESEIEITKSKLEPFLKNNDAEVREVIKTVRKINFEKFEATKESIDAIIAVKEEIENVKAITTEIDILISKINEEREPENYIEFKEQSLNNFLNKLQLAENNKQLSKLKELYVLYKSKKDNYLQLEQLSKPFDDKINALVNVNDKYKDFKKLSSDLMELYSLQKNVSQNFHNKLISTYSDVLLEPSRFEELMKANDVIETKALAKQIGTDTNSNATMPVGTDVFKATENLRIFHTFFSSKSMLGVFAKLNVIQQLLLSEGVNLKARTTNKNNPFVTKSIYHNLLLSPEQAALVESNGYLNTSATKDVTGIIKQLWTSQFINATVDAAKDPYFANFKLSYTNIGIATLLTGMLGYPVDVVFNWLNQPGLIEYVNNIDNGLTKTEANIESIRRLGLKVLVPHAEETITKAEYDKLIDRNKVTKEYVNIKAAFTDKNRTDVIISYSMYEDISAFGYDNPKTGTFNTYNSLLQNMNSREFLSGSGIVILSPNGTATPIFDIVKNENISLERFRNLSKSENDLAKLDDSIINGTETRSSIISAELNSLAMFNNVESYNYDFRDLSNYLSFDTKKIDSIFDINSREQLRKNILVTGIIDKTSLVKLETESFISSFNNMKEIKDIYNVLLPLTSQVSQGLQPIIDNYNSNYSYKSNKNTRVLPLSIQNDFIYSILYNFGTKAKSGFELLTKITERDEDGNVTYMDIVDKMSAFRKNAAYKDLVKTFPILENIIGMVHYREESAKLHPELTNVFNIQLLKNPNMSLVEEKSIIQQFDDLLNTETIHPNPKINTSVKTLIQDIYNVALAQSGLNKSYISFRELIPIDYYKEDFENALNTYSNLSNSEKLDYVEKFNRKFEYNNKTLFPKLMSEKTFDYVPKNFNNSQANIKIYDINVGELIKPSISTEIYSRLGNVTQSEHVKLRPFDQLKDAKSAFVNAGIVSTRIDTQTIIPGSGAEHFGNPFSNNKALLKKGVPLIETASIKEAVQKYINWILTGETGVLVYTDATPDENELSMQRDWIVKQLKSGKLKGVDILYYKELKQPSHATALDYLINKYDWSKENVIKEATIKEKVEKVKKEKVAKQSKKEKTYTSKQAKAMTAKSLYAQVNKLDEPVDARGLALSYIAGGGKISPESLYNDVITRRDSRLVPTKSQTQQEVSSRDYIIRGGKTVKEVSHSLWGGLADDIQDAITTQDVENALIEVISENNTRYEAATAMLQEYTPSEDSSEFLDQNPEDFKTDDFKCD